MSIRIIPIAIKEELQSLPPIRLFDMIKDNKKYRLIDEFKEKNKKIS